MISRRTFLGTGVLAGAAALGGAVWAVEERVLPGRAAFNHFAGLDGPAGSIPLDAVGFVRTGVMNSDAYKGPLKWQVSYPTAVIEALPVVIALHGLDGDFSSSFGNGLHLDKFLAAHVNQGGTPVAIASVDGGPTSYWHERTSGMDSGRMVTDEFIPMLNGLGLSTDTVGLFGWSMGGYGAMHIAVRLGRSRVAGCVASGPAIWPRYNDIQSNAFDSLPEFNRDNIFGQIDALRGINLRVDCGTDDAFYDNTKQLRTLVRPEPEGGFAPGGHRMEYWTRMVPEQLAFLADSF